MDIHASLPPNLVGLARMSPSTLTTDPRNPHLALLPLRGRLAFLGLYEHWPEHAAGACVVSAQGDIKQTSEDYILNHRLHAARKESGASAHSSW